MRDRLKAEAWLGKVIRFIVLLSWIPLISTLFPLPWAQVEELSKIAKQIDQEVLEKAKAIDEHKRGNTILSDRRSEQWRQWSIGFVIVAVGICAGIMAVTKSRHWMVAAIIAASAYLILYAKDMIEALDLVKQSLLYVNSDSVVFNLVQTKIKSVEMMFSVAPNWFSAISFAYLELVMPILQTCVVIFVLVQWIRRAPDNNAVKK